MRKKSSLSSVLDAKGFTLIELLVVVLIIGILTAVALPQYKTAVDKARLANLTTMLRSVINAQDAYHLANGTYTQDWDSLSIDFAGTIVGNQLFSEGYRIVLNLSGGGAANGATAYDDKLPDDVFLYAFYDQDHRLNCYAKASNNYANKLCKNISRQTTRYKGSGTGENSYYVYAVE